MAAPHAAGLVALYLAEFGRDIDRDGRLDADVNGDGVRNSADVYGFRQAPINRGFDQLRACSR